MPVLFVSFFDALRFANWMNNGQGNGDTESGAYTLLGPYTTSTNGGATPSNGTTVTRNPAATIAITSENEWYKAAYYDAGSASYFDYPAGSNAQTICSTPTATPNRANCGNVGGLTIVGSYTGSPSPYGTFDQGGNVDEWNEAILFGGSSRGHRGEPLDASFRGFASPSFEGGIGIRLVMIPEPGTGLLVIAGVLGLAGWRRANAWCE